MPEHLEKFSSARCVLIPVKKGDVSDCVLDFGGAILTSAENLKIDRKEDAVTENFSAMDPVVDSHKIAILPSVSDCGHALRKVPITCNEFRRDLLVRYDTATEKCKIVGFGINV